MGDRTSIQCVVGTGDLPLAFTWLKDDVPLLQVASVSSSSSVVAGVKHSSSLHQHHDKINEANDKQANSDVINDSAAITIRQYDDFTSALSITSVNRGQAGNYSCRVQNDAAIAIHSAILRVNGSNLV